MIHSIVEKIKSDARWKTRVLRWMMHPVKTRPRFWLRCLQFLYIRKGKKSVIYRSVRKDIVPFHRFEMGRLSVIEDYSVVNNAVGDVIVGNYTRIGLGNTIIGPVMIGSEVNLAQNVVVSGLNHHFEDVSRSIAEQGVSIRPVIIEDDVWIGANSVVLQGVRIGKHAVVGAGSVVTKDLPSYCVAAGNPARIIKKFDFEKNDWVKQNV